MKKNISWLGAAIILIIIFGTIGVLSKTIQRATANDPQIQLAEDTAARFNSGVTPQSVITGSIDFEHSLDPFIIIYNKAGKPIGGSGYLQGKLADVPYGVLQAANHVEYHSVTWQPQADTRVAAVVVSSNNYYVLSGRSLRIAEHNENLSYELSGLGLAASLLVLAATYIVKNKA